MFAMVVRQQTCGDMRCLASRLSGPERPSCPFLVDSVSNSNRTSVVDCIVNCIVAIVQRRMNASAF